jgi:hypothetical protein
LAVTWLTAACTPAPTPAPVQTQPPIAVSATATVTRTATRLPTRTLSPTAEPAILTLQRNANCRKGPGVAYNIVTALLQGVQVVAVGRNTARDWWFVQAAEVEGCWVGDSNVERSGPLTDLPVLPSLPLPEDPYVLYDETICTKKVYKVTLHWQDVSDETGYRIYRDGQLVDAVEANSTRFVTYAPFGRDLTYELESFNENGASRRLDTTVLACTKK